MTDLHREFARELLKHGIIMFDPVKGFELKIHRELKALFQKLGLSEGTRLPFTEQKIAALRADNAFTISPRELELLKREFPDRSPFFADFGKMKEILLVDLAVEVLKELIQSKEISFEIIAGISTGANETAKYLATSLDVPYLKVHETTLWRPDLPDLIPFSQFSGKVGLVIGDLFTTGASKLGAIALLRKVGINVNDVLVFLDREQGGAKVLEQAGLKQYAVFTITGLLGFYDDYMHRARLMVQEYLRRPQNQF